MTERRFREDVAKEIGSLCTLTDGETAGGIVKSCIPKLSLDELITLREKYRRRYDEQFPFSPQISGAIADKREEHHEFLI